MEFFRYEIIASSIDNFYVSVHENIITVSSYTDEFRSRKENVEDYSWGICLQNLVLFSINLMSDLNFKIIDTSFKSKLQKILHRIKQFEKLGNIDLSSSVLVLFVSELFDLISAWLLFAPNIENYLHQKTHIIDTTIGLLCIFHILYQHVCFTLINKI
jgi:hypothetical protein